MTFLFIIPSLQSGGMERVMATLLFHFTRQHPKVNLHLVLYGRKRDVFYDVPGSIKIHRPSFQFNNQLRFWHTLKTLWFLRKTINQLQPDTILSFGERWNNLVLLAGLGKKWPIYVSDRCQPDKSLGQMQDILRKWLYPKAFGVIAQTAQAQKIYRQQKLNGKIPVIGNPIQQWKPKRFEEREKIVLSVGRLITTKHHAELIEIFADINKPEWQLVIVGGDALKQNNSRKLQQLISDLGVEDKVTLTGTVKEVTDWYQKSSLFAFPSSSEGFPNVLGEALAHGLPVVAFDCVAGPRDMVTNGVNGYLVENMDFKGFKNKLRQLMEDVTLRAKMAEQAPASVERFDEQVIGERFYQTLTSHL